MKRRKKVFIAIAVLLAVTVGGRFYARYCAWTFGDHVAGSFSLMGRKAFADTAALREYFAQPNMAGYVNRVRQLSFLGGHYDERVSDLQAGMIYYSEQASLPPEKRFAAPPALKHFTVGSSDHSDEGLGKAAGNLILSYLLQLWPWSSAP